MSKIPATIVTGFLGAGKTSLIRHLLQNADGRRIALIINEFGDLGIDGEIVRGCEIPGCEDEDVVELANGCICCTVADDFLPTMERLLARDRPPQHIVIETSGLALPKPLIRAFNWPDVRTRVTVDGVITVLDAPAVAGGTFASAPDAVQRQREADDMLDHDTPLGELFEDQLNAADLIVLNKTDLVDEATRAAVEDTVRRAAPRPTKLLHSRHGALPLAVAFGIGAAAEDDLAARPSHHDDEDEHDHDDFDSVLLDLPSAADPAVLNARIEAVLARPDILRAKGFGAVDGRDMRLVLQGVGGRLDSYFDRPWRADEARIGRLVVIGYRGFDADAVRRALAG